MIIKIFQGPGNQMFQYAYALAASKRIGAELKLDLSWYDENSAHRPYILDRFNISAAVATKEEVEYVKSKNAPNFLNYRWNILRDSIALRHKKAVVFEDLSKVDLDLLNPYKNSYVEGYFTSELFFNDFEKEVRQELRFQPTISQSVKEIVDSIDVNTVAISIRRGDFIGNQLHNICSKEYFYRAIEKTQEAIENPTLLIFSDELEWITENMKFDVPHSIVPKLEDSMDYMRLMSYCSNHIIPNSTFSWWGAWLSKPKLVIAPDFWLAQDV
ncbi:MAG TPA: hypothetical protein DCR04_10645, partial [Flavobacteriales bacterium]|nr:hypothetical protein [Flavobacteriales bacterium]